MTLLSHRSLPLRFIYTCTEPNWRGTDTDFTLRLLTVADKYCLMELRTVCLAHLLRCLTPENAVTTFLTFQQLGLKTGEELVFSYLREHNRAVMASPAWQDFLEAEPRRAADLLVRVLSQSSAVSTTLPSILPSAPSGSDYCGDSGVKRIRSD